MNRRTLLVLALILCLAALGLHPPCCAAGISDPEQAQEFSVAPSDKVLLDKVLAQTGVETTPPKPEWTEYLALLMETFFRWLVEAFEPVGRGITWIVSYAGYAAAALLAVAAIAAVALAVRVLVKTLRTRRKTVTTAVHVLPLPGDPRQGGSAWREQIDQRMAAGDVAGAIEALWWWLATTLAGTGADASWTTRELILWANRKDLMPACRTMDRMIYSSTRPTIPDLRLLVSQLEREIA